MIKKMIMDYIDMEFDNIINQETIDLTRIKFELDFDEGKIDQYDMIVIYWILLDMADNKKI